MSRAHRLYRLALHRLECPRSTSTPFRQPGASYRRKTLCRLGGVRSVASPLQLSLLVRVSHERCALGRCEEDHLSRTSKETQRPWLESHTVTSNSRPRSKTPSAERIYIHIYIKDAPPIHLIEKA